MANKLLTTVYDLNKQINDLKNGYATMLDALLNNPDIGTPKLDTFNDIINDAKDGYPTLRDKIISIDNNYADIIAKVNSLTYEDVDNLKKSIDEARGVYGSLKEALDNSGVELSVNYNNDTTSLVVANSNSVESEIYTIPTNTSKTFKVDQLVANGLFDVLIRDTYPNKTVKYNLYNEDTIYNTVNIDKLSDGYFGLKFISQSSIFDVSTGAYYQATNYVEYDCVGKMFAYTTSLPLSAAYRLGNVFKPFANKASGADFYKTTSTANKSYIYAVFDNPVYISTLRIYPYTVENNTATVQVTIGTEVGGQIYDNTFINPKMNGGSTPNCYVEIPVGAMCKSIVITLGVDGVTAFKYFNSCEIYTRPTIVNSDTVETVPKPINIYDLHYLTSVATTSVLDVKYNNIMWFPKNGQKTYMYKPQNYTLPWNAFVDQTGRPCTKGKVVSYTDAFAFPGFSANAGVIARVSSRLSHDTSYIAKMCVRGWDKNIKFTSTVQTYDNNMKYLLSFDEGVTWYYYKGTTWGICSINDINIYGMDKSELLNIPKSEMAGKLNNFLNIAVRSLSPTNFFTSLSLDTGDDKFIEVQNENDLKYCIGNYLSNLSSIKPYSFDSLLQGSYSLNLSIRFVLVKDSLSFTPKIKDMTFNVNSRYYWRNLDANDLTCVKISYFEGYAEINNAYPNDITVKVNSMVPKETVLIDKNTGTNISNMSNIIGEYKSNESFISSIVASAKKSLNMENYILNEASYANTKLLVQLYCKAGFNYSGNNLFVNAITTNNLTILSDATFSYTPGRYTIQPATTLSSVVSQLYSTPIEGFSKIRISEYCSKVCEHMYIILNEELEIEVFNNEITIEDIRLVYSKPIDLIRVKLQYRSLPGTAQPIYLYGYGIMFLDRSYILDNNKVKISIPFDGQSSFKIPFYREHENYIKVYLNEVPQKKGIDYELNFSVEPTLNWISPDFDLETDDELVVEIITQ